MRVERPEDVVGAQLETVLFAQMLALFAPHTVQAAQHLPLLLSTLASRQPSLRRAAAATLRHLAERCRCRCNTALSPMPGSEAPMCVFLMLCIGVQFVSMFICLGTWAGMFAHNVIKFKFEP